jgi:hypothetical protein
MSHMLEVLWGHKGDADRRLPDGRRPLAVRRDLERRLSPREVDDAR